MSEPRYPKAMRWDGSALVLLDQTKLPMERVDFRCDTVDQVVDAIKRLVVRGAPAIGVAAAYGVALAARHDLSSAPGAIDRLAASRPTAVNLFWALDRMRKRLGEGADAAQLLEEAAAIEKDDIERCRKIGENGAALLPDEGVVITHCHAGALATAGMGTALGVVHRAVELGKKITVISDETRPLLQGSRITAWELMSAGIDVTVITDGMAAAVMARMKIDAVIVGADRIAANGDTANKIGTYGLAVSARHHGIPFYVAAPDSTVDRSIADGSGIPIEERDPEEITNRFGLRTAPENVKTFNPAFDVTPHALITMIITDQGAMSVPDFQSMNSRHP